MALTCVLLDVLVVNNIIPYISRHILHLFEKHILLPTTYVHGFRELAGFSSNQITLR